MCSFSRSSTWARHTELNALRESNLMMVDRHVRPGGHRNCELPWAPGWCRVCSRATAGVRPKEEGPNPRPPRPQQRAPHVPTEGLADPQRPHPQPDSRLPKSAEHAPATDDNDLVGHLSQG